MKRKKRIVKGIESLEKQRKIHEEKKAMAKREGKQELAEYYEKELEKFEKEVLKKRKLFRK